MLLNIYSLRDTRTHEYRCLHRKFKKLGMPACGQCVPGLKIIEPVLHLFFFPALFFPTDYAQYIFC